jgi:hypothetical protein
MLSRRKRDVDISTPSIDNKRMTGSDQTSKGQLTVGWIGSATLVTEVTGGSMGTEAVMSLSSI